jgi:hypothetical protein
VADNNDTIKTLQERDKLLDEQVQALDNISKHSQQIGRKFQEIVVFAENAKDNVNKSKEINKILVGNPQKFIAVSTDWKPLIENDKNFVSFLQNYDHELEDLNLDTAMMAASGSAMPVMASSSTSGAVYLSIYSLNDPQINEEIENVRNHIFENLEFIKNELLRLSPGIVNHFDSIIRDWYNAGDSDFKYKYILNLRSVIFYQLFDTFCKETDYQKTNWFNSAHDKRMRLSQTKFFILGFKDENKLHVVQKQQINQLAEKMQQFFNDMSEFGKTGIFGSNPDILFENVITHFRIIIELRKTFFQGKI